MFNNLYKWTIENDVERRTINSFWNIINNFKSNSPERLKKYFGNEFCRESLNITFYKVSFSIGNWPANDFNYITSYAKIEYNNEEHGIYKVVFKLNGEIEDDYWASDED